MTMIADHDPASCTRTPCRRCTPSPPPASPPIRSNPHDAATVAARSIPIVEHATLVERLRAFLLVLDTPKAALAWQRLDAWEDPGPMPKQWTDGTDEDDALPPEQRPANPGAAERREEWLADRRIGGYRAELDTLAELFLQSIPRVEHLVSVAVPARAKHLQDLDLQKAQVGAAGLCISCWRDEQTLTPVAVRADGGAYYKDRCRWCGIVKATEGMDPPLEILRLHHAGRRISTLQMEAALRKVRDGSKGKAT